MHVKGAVAVITGGARGFGRAFSEALLRRGCKVSNCSCKKDIIIDIVISPFARASIMSLMDG